MMRTASPAGRASAGRAAKRPFQQLPAQLHELRKAVDVGLRALRHEGGEGGEVRLLGVWQGGKNILQPGGSDDRLQQLRRPQGGSAAAWRSATR